MNYNVYYNYNAPTSRTGKLESYAVFDALNEDHALRLADDWLNERHGDGHYNVWSVMPSHEFVDEDDYSTGF